MALATILAVIDGGPGSEQALAAALQVGQDHSAHVELLHVEAEVDSSVPILGEGMSGAAVEQVIQTLRDEAETRSAEARRLYDTRCVAENLPIADPEVLPEPNSFDVGFRPCVGSEPVELVRHGRIADLIVMALPADGATGTSHDSLDAALFESGRPVLLAPPKMPAQFGSAVSVAWDGSREAVRAVAAALPILAKAERVVLLSAQEPRKDARPSELARYLRAHGIDARTWAFTPGDVPIGAALLDEAQKAGTDLLVMGAYSHSRLRELVLGGATRHILQAATIPVLMAH
jgi:nucleotide-binding universal stress UspA family protein